MLLAQAQKFADTAVVYDKDQGLHVLIRALGGQYFTLRMGEKTGRNPFQMEPTQRNVAFMRRLVSFLAQLKGEPVDTQESQEISTAIEQMTSLIDRSSRSLSAFITLSIGRAHV